MIVRTFDPELVNSVVNAPEVRPFVGPGADFLDLSDHVSKPENLFLMGEHGGFALVWSAPEAYEVHTFILNGGRGKWARNAAQEAMNYMAEQGASLLWTKIPDDQPNVAAFAAAMGMKPTGQIIETFGKPYAVYKMGAGTCQ